MRLLLLEDEQLLADEMISALERANFTVDHAADGLTGANLAQKNWFDLIILDLTLPRKDGRVVLRDLRKNKRHIPVLILGEHGTKDSIVELLDSGADDYLTKPLDLDELTARAKALVRRSKGGSTPIVHALDLELDTVRQTVKRAGSVIELSPTEYRIIEYLALRPGAIVSKDELREQMHRTHWKHPSNVIEAHMSNLRKKLEAPGKAQLIETFRNRGYRFREGKVQPLAEDSAKVS